jgi:hypothetical protein
MRRNPQLINLYDKPLYRRPLFASPDRAASSGDGLCRLLACVAILLGTGAFFWAYDMIAHREPSYVPLRAQAVTYRTSLIVPEAVAPDMNSELVRIANADVPLSVQKIAMTVDTHKTKLVDHAEAPPKKKKTRVVKRRLPERAMQAYAWVPNSYSAPFGGY